MWMQNKNAQLLNDIFVHDKISTVNYFETSIKLLEAQELDHHIMMAV